MFNKRKFSDIDFSYCTKKKKIEKKDENEENHNI